MGGTLLFVAIVSTFIVHSQLRLRPGHPFHSKAINGKPQHGMSFHCKPWPSLSLLGFAILSWGSIFLVLLCHAVHGFAILSLTFISLTTISLAGQELAGLKRSDCIVLAKRGMLGMPELVRLFRWVRWGQQGLDRQESLAVRWRASLA